MKKSTIYIKPTHQLSALCSACKSIFDVEIKTPDNDASGEAYEENCIYEDDLRFSGSINDNSIICPKCLKKSIAVDCMTFAHDIAPIAKKFVHPMSFANLVTIYAPGCTVGKLYLLPDKETGFKVAHKPAIISFYTPDTLSSALTSPQNTLSKFIGIPYGWYVRRNPNKELEEHIFELVEAQVDTDVPRSRLPGYTAKQMEAQATAYTDICDKRRELHFTSLNTWLDQILIPTWSDAQLMCEISMRAERIQRGDDDL